METTACVFFKHHALQIRKNVNPEELKADKTASSLHQTYPTMLQGKFHTLILGTGEASIYPKFGSLPLSLSRLNRTC